MLMNNHEKCKCGDSKHYHSKGGTGACKATWKMGTEWCDCDKFLVKEEENI